MPPHPKPRNPPPPPQSKKTHNPSSNSSKRKADAISTTSNDPSKQPPQTQLPPTQSGFTISSLPTNLTQSTPKPKSKSTTNPLPTTSQFELDPSLQTSHDVIILSIISSTQITKRVTKILEHLSSWPAKEGEKDKIVVLIAKGDVVGKLISVVEIVKREVDGKGGKWFQYTAVEGRMEDVKKKERSCGKGKGGDERKVEREGEGEGKGNGEKEMEVEKEEEEKEEEEKEEEEKEEGFEVMKTPFERSIEGRPKVREVPFMIVYLSRGRIDFLRKKYGEQTNAQPIK